MNKPNFIVIGDLHFGQRNFNKDVFNQQMMFFEEQIFPYILEHDIKLVIQCGDMYHDRNRIDWYIYNQLYIRFFRWFEDNDVKLHIVLGNHDTYSKSTLDNHSLSESTKTFDNTIVHDTVGTIKHGKYTLGFVPWIINHKEYTLPSSCDILFGHFDLVGFPMMKGITSKDGISYKDFAKYKLVLSGHYHTRHIEDNVHMVGTPYQLTFNDFNEDKGFYVFDDAFNYEFVENKVNPKFAKLYYDNDIITVVGTNNDETITKVEALEVAKNNYCRLYVKKADNQLELDTFYTSLTMCSCADYKIEIIYLMDVIEDFDSSEFDEKFDEEESTIQLIVSCIDGMTFDESLDKKLLKELIKIEYKSASDMALGMGDE